MLDEYKHTIYCLTFALLHSQLLFLVGGNCSETVGHVYGSKCSSDTIISSPLNVLISLHNYFPQEDNNLIMVVFAHTRTTGNCVYTLGVMVFTESQTTSTRLSKRRRAWLSAKGASRQTHDTAESRPQQKGNTRQRHYLPRAKQCRTTTFYHMAHPAAGNSTTMFWLLYREQLS